MQISFLVASFATLLSVCSNADQASAVAGFAGFRPSPVSKAPVWGTAQEVKFARDLRLVDGNLVEITLTKSFRNRYDAFKHVVTSGMDGQIGDTTDTLAQGLTCENGFADEVGTLTSVRCWKDMRPADGALEEVVFVMDDEGKYSATLLVTLARFSGDQVDQPRVTELGKGLILSITDAGMRNPPMTCMAYWHGFQYDFGSDACVARGSSGCGNPFKFTEQDACDAATHAVSLTGKLDAVMAIGGETTGYALVFADGSQVEVDATPAIIAQLADLLGEEVDLTGNVEHRTGVEIPTRRVVMITTIQKAQALTVQAE